MAGVCFAERRWKADAAGMKLAAVGVAEVAGMLLAAVGVEDWRLVEGLAICWLARRMLALARNSHAVGGEVAAV